MQNNKMILEADAENTKPKRGRPRLMVSGWYNWLREAFPEIKSERGLQNKDYEIQAIGILKKHPAFRWILDPEKMDARVSPGDEGYKPGILTELGRLGDEDAISEAASEICRIKPKTKDAIVMIRRWRTGNRPQGDAHGLCDCLCKALNDYTSKHDTTWDEVDIALFALKAELNELRGES